MSQLLDEPGIPFYHLQCDCGCLVQVTAAQAGETLPCHLCQKLLSIPSLTALQKRTPDGHLSSSEETELQRNQFDLAHLMAFVTVIAILLSIDKTIRDYSLGYWWIATQLLFILFAVFPFACIAIVQRISWIF